MADAEDREGGIGEQEEEEEGRAWDNTAAAGILPRLYHAQFFTFL